ncbi:OadG family transporter subunit [Candidatus Weimeria sp. HCP3S3_B5]|uniref:OadG family transporter subunit n=1 Tax=Candidatus Weimeria sp. HCP3S3_B5 TaxID=3438871 RepID=UPI002A9F7B04|nr:OadG family transporter subunit [Lachnospiraceae bacterium]
MKKKTGIILALVLSVCLLASCGKAATSYGGHSVKELESSQQGMAKQLLSMSSSDLKQAYSYYKQQSQANEEDKSSKMYMELVSNWQENKKGLGEFKNFGKFTVAKSGKTITTTQVLKFQNRDARLIFVYQTYNMKVSSMNFEKIYSLGETMGKAALNVVMGMVTVFCVLILISLVIYAFNIIPYLQNKHKNKEEAAGQQQQAARTVAEVVPEEDDGELIAVISAAIAASTGASTDSFVVRNIKRRY